MQFSAKRSSSNQSKPLANAVVDIRNVVVTIATGQKLAPGICSSWTSFHGETVRNHGLAPWLYRKLNQHPECGLSAGIMSAFSSNPIEFQQFTAPADKPL